MEHIDRITAEDYVPEFDEIIRLRQYTIGASTTSFYTDKNWFTLIDVGGQTPERSKWTAIVQDRDVHCMLYFAALDDYNVKSAEDPSMTNFDVSLQVWKEVTTSELFPHESTVLFLNKVDLFENQIKDKKLFKAFKKRFKKYDGGQNVEECLEFLKAKFAATSKGENEIIMHATCAIDTNQVEVVWNNVRKSIVQKRSMAAGMYV